MDGGRCLTVMVSILRMPAVHAEIAKQAKQTAIKLIADFTMRMWFAQKQNPSKPLRVVFDWKFN